MPMVKTKNVPEAERGQIFRGLRQTICKSEGEVSEKDNMI